MAKGARANRHNFKLGHYPVVARIENFVSLLSKYPTIGRTTDKEGVRLMGLRPYPYVVFYKIIAGKNEVRILRVRHTARRPLMRTPDR
jgi:plasmid stabilization system protein ParE